MTKLSLSNLLAATAIAALSFTGLLTGSAANVPVAQVFSNPILPKGQDPSVAFDGVNYRLVQSDPEGITIRTSSTLTGLAVADKTVVWQGGQDGSPCCEIWAPEILRLDGKWYIYFAADDGDNAHHRMYVLEANAPLGPYSFKGKITDSSDKWAIDGTVMQTANAKRYFLWSGWEGDVNVRQNLYVAPMSNAWTISGPRTLISAPTQAWEKRGSDGVSLPFINEGPESLASNGKTFVAYSASGSWSDDYCIGLLTLNGNDPTVGGNWTKSKDCVFQRNDSEDVFAPGHHGFTRSPDGKETWILYHAIQFSGASWGGRSVRAQRLDFTVDGVPNFGQPTGFSRALPLPSGEFEAEQATLINAKAVQQYGASGNAEVPLRDNSGSGVKVTVDEPQGPATLNLRYARAAAGDGVVVLSINAGPPDLFAVPSTGSATTFATLSLPVQLPNGPTVIAISERGPGFDLDTVALAR